jgi:hypothetical protein
MKVLFFILFNILFFSSFSQDTIRYEDIDFIFNNDYILEKIFYKKDKVDIRIVYYYKDDILVKRIWLRRDKIIGISIE